MSKSMRSLFAGAALLALAYPGAQAADEHNTVAFVPQIVGIPYFNAMEEGGKKAAGALGVKFIYSGPVDTNPVDQLQIVQNLVNQESARFRSAYSTHRASRPSSKPRRPKA